MRKQFLSTLLALCAVLTFLPMSVFAEEKTIVVSGECGAEGDNVTWTLDSGGTLTIRGTGNMAKYLGTEDNSVPWRDNSANITALVIGEGVAEVDSLVFEDTKITHVTLPTSVQLDTSPFTICPTLESIEVASGNPYYYSVDGVLYHNQAKRLIRYPSAKSGESYIIPDGIETIGGTAFRGCSNLTSVHLPESIYDIYQLAFSECSSLISIWIPAHVSAIEYDAFDRCKALSDVYYSGTKEQWNTIMIDTDGDTGITSPNISTSTGNRYLLAATIHCTDGVINPKPLALPNKLAWSTETPGQINWSVSGNCRRNFEIKVYSTEDDTTPVFSAEKQFPEGETYVYNIPLDELESGCYFFTVRNIIDEAENEGGGDNAYKNSELATSTSWSYTKTVQPAPDDPEPDTPSLNCTLSGTITGHQGVAYTSVTAKLVGLDGTEYYAAVTGGESLDGTMKKECTYSASAPAGQYNLVVEATAASGTTVNRTALVKLSGDQTKNVNLPNGQAKSNVTVKKSATEVIAGNLDSLIVSDDGSLIAGASAEVTLTVDDVDTSTTEAVSIQNAASGQTMEFVEFTIRKTVDGTTTDVSDTGNSPIEIVLSFKNAGKRNVKVYRYHDGRVDTLTEQAVNGEKIEVTANSITICAKKFSVYAIGYDSAPENQTPVSGSSSSSNSSSSSFGPSYSITVPNRITGGKVEVSTDSAKRGDAVTVITTPDEGYMTATVAVTDVSGNTLTLTDNDNGKYTFTMPASNVGLNVTFAKLDNNGSSVTNPFTDVSDGAYYYDAVLWASGNGITNGTSATTFSPDAACTRAQIVTFLWRAAGSPAPESESSANPFTDVSTGAYYYDAVLWAVEQDISNGTSATTFSPDVACTRAQAVTFLWRAGEAPSVSSGSGFSDVADSDYYANAVKWAVANGVTNGTGSATFSPDADCTRGQIVTFLYRDRVN